MKKLFVAGVAAAALSVASPAHAIFVECPDCSHWEQQLIDAANLVETKLSAAETAINTLNTYKAWVVNTLSLPQRLFYNFTGEIMSLRQVANVGSLLGGHSNTMLQSLGAGAGGFSQITDVPGRMFQDLRQVAVTANAAGRVIDDALELSTRQSQQFAVLENQAAGAEGIKGTNQAQAALLATMAQAQASRDQAILAALQALITIEVARADREGLEHANSASVISQLRSTLTVKE